MGWLLFIGESGDFSHGQDTVCVESWSADALVNPRHGDRTLTLRATLALPLRSGPDARPHLPAGPTVARWLREPAMPPSSTSSARGAPR